ncbi:MAG: hypothetical protein NEHIOOID_00875 [Holosporales bacterium]
MERIHFYRSALLIMIALLSEANASQRRGFGDVTSSLAAKADQLDKEAQQAKTERDFLDKQKGILDEEDKSRFVLEKQYQDETDTKYEDFSRERNRLSILDDAADRMFPTVDEEDHAFHQMMKEFQDGKKQIEAKEALVQKINVQLSNGEVLKVRRDVLELSRFLKDLLADEEQMGVRDVLPLPEIIKPEIAKKIFDYLESKLTPGNNSVKIFEPVESADDLLLFIKKNIDILNALYFLNIYPDFDTKLDTETYRLYKNQHGRGEKEYPKYSLDGYKYDVYAPATVENINYFVGEDVKSAIPGYSRHFNVSDASDIDFIMNNSSELFLKFSREISFKDTEIPFQLSASVIDTLVIEWGFRLSIPSEGIRIFADKKWEYGKGSVKIDVSWNKHLENYHKYPDSYLKDIIHDYILTKNYFYNLENVQELPDDLIQHIKRNLGINNDNIFNRLSDKNTLGARIINETVFAKMMELKTLMILRITELENLLNVPDDIAKNITLRIFEIHYLNSLLISLNSKEEKDQTKDLIDRVIKKGFIVDVENALSPDRINRLKLDVDGYIDYILTIMEQEPHAVKELRLSLGDMSNDQIARVSRFMNSATNLTKVIIRPQNAEQIKLFLSGVSSSRNFELVVSDYYYHTEDSGNRNKKDQDNVYNMIVETSKFNGKKTFHSTFKGSSGAYPLDDLRNRVSPFQNPNFTIELGKY